MRRFVARQPILDLRGEVVAYELLYRAGHETAFIEGTDQDEASAQVIAESCLLHGLDTLTDGRRAFVNMTRKGIVDGYAHALPRHRVVCELLETIEPDNEVIAACRKLKSEGYRLALDDFRYDPAFEPLLSIASVVKVDLLEWEPAELEELSARLRRTNAKLLAEKVEDQEAYDRAVELGFSLFQGYFFGKPKTLSTESIDSNKARYFCLLQQINRPEMDFAELERTLRQEAGLCVRLLKFVNSVSLSLRTPVDSIGRALVILGEREIRKWALFLVMSELAGDKPRALITQVTQRARFAELLAPRFQLQDRADSLFMLGLLSRLDTMMDRPLADLLEELPLADDIKQALLGGDNPLRQVYDYVLAYEQADWETVEATSQQLRCEEERIASLYEQAVSWAGTNDDA